MRSEAGRFIVIKCSGYDFRSRVPRGIRIPPPTLAVTFNKLKDLERQVLVAGDLASNWWRKLRAMARWREKNK